MAKRIEDPLDSTRHSCAHLLAATVLDLYPGSNNAIGPAIEDGFYQDFDLHGQKISDEDLPMIETKMHEILKGWHAFEHREVTADEARRLFAHNPYKLALIDEFALDGKSITVNDPGNFLDLCKGGHSDNPQEDLKNFKLLRIAGAYWKGDEKNKMLTRIYGTVWPTKKELGDYLEMQEEAKRRDHRKLGVELDLFHFEEYSPGMPYWHQKGMVIYRELDKFARELEGYGFHEIKTPELVSPELYKKSGHYEHYLEDMFKVLDGDKEYFLKPMNCPEALLVFKSKKRSYRELPMRLANFDVLHRTEATKVFQGLTRVRELSQDDAHILCTPEQAEGEFAERLEEIKKAFKVLKLKTQYYLSTRPEGKLGNDAEWDQAEGALKASLEKAQLGYEIDPGEGNFYGPKIDVFALDALGRRWQLSTLQYDMQQPKGLGAKYTDSTGTEKTPIMIHRAVLGSFERLIGILTEHHNGAFPTWLSPVQAIVLPITDAQNSYAKDVLGQVTGADIRAEVNLNSEKIGAKIRDAQLQKVPYMLIIGQKEVDEKSASLRLRTGDDLHSMPVPDIISRIQKEIQERS
jgi:threonyl-tRNA synthetase